MNTLTNHCRADSIKIPCVCAMEAWESFIEFRFNIEHTQHAYQCIFNDIKCES